MTGSKYKEVQTERRYASSDLLTSRTSKTKSVSFMGIAKAVSDDINFSSDIKKSVDFKSTGSHSFKDQVKRSVDFKDVTDTIRRSLEFKANEFASGEFDSEPKAAVQPKPKPRNEGSGEESIPNIRSEIMRDFASKRRQSIVPQQIIDIAKGPRAPRNMIDEASSMQSGSESSVNSKSSQSVDRKDDRLLDKLYRSMSLDRISQEEKDKKPDKDAGGLDVAKLGNSALRSVLPGTEEKEDKKEKKARKFNEQGSEEAKEVVVDVIMRMIKKVGARGKKTSEKYFREIYREMEDFSLSFKHVSLEAQFRMDFNSVTGWPFLRSTLQILLVEILLVFLSIFNALRTGEPILGNALIFRQALANGAAGVGVQSLICGVTVFASMEEET